MQSGKTEARQKQIDMKLNRIAKLLEEVLIEINKEEPELSPSLIKKLTARWKAIDQGKVKLHHYKNLEEFEKTLGG